MTVTDRAAQGEGVAALDTLLPRLTRDLLAYFLRRVEIAADAADLVGEVLLVAARRPERIPTTEEDARRWLFGVAARVLDNHRRGRRRALALAERMRDELAALAAQHEQDADPAEAFEREAVRATLGRLPERDAELVRLIHWDGFAVQEAGAVLGLSPSGARSRYARARERLRVLLAD